MATCDINILEEHTLSNFTALVFWRWQRCFRPEAANTFWWSRKPQYVV